MIPQGGTIRNEPVQEQQQPSYTWKVDWEKGRIIGNTDGLDAIKQAVFCILKTDRFRHLIFSANYGQEITRLIGKNAAYVEPEIRRMIREALLQDDRITDIQNIQIEFNGDAAFVSFRVVADIGSFDEGVEVSV